MVEEKTYSVTAKGLNIKEFTGCEIDDKYRSSIDFIIRKIGGINKYGVNEEFSINMGFEDNTILYYKQGQDNYPDRHAKENKIKNAVSKVITDHTDNPDDQHITISHVLTGREIAKIISAITESDEATAKINAWYRNVPKSDAERHGFPPGKTTVTETSAEYNYFRDVKKTV